VIAISVLTVGKGVVRYRAKKEIKEDPFPIM
jgi:hypothetical protein